MTKIKVVSEDKTGRQFFVLDEDVDHTGGKDKKIMILYQDDKGKAFVQDSETFWYNYSVVNKVES